MEDKERQQFETSVTKLLQQCSQSQGSKGKDKENASNLSQVEKEMKDLLLPLSMKDQQSAQRRAFIQSLLQSPQLYSSISDFLDRGTRSDDGDKIIMTWLYEWYTLPFDEYQIFVLQYFPFILQTYLLTNSPALEALIVGVYNWHSSVGGRKGGAGNEEVLFTPPSTSISSSLHNASRSNPQVQIQTLTDDALAQHNNKTASAFVVEKKLTAIKTINATNRDQVLKFWTNEYSSRAFSMNINSLSAFTTTVNKLVSSGYNNIPVESSGGSSKADKKQASSQQQQNRRIVLSAGLLQAFIGALVSIGMPSTNTQLRASALSAIRSIHVRSRYDLVPETLLSTTAILHSLSNLNEDPNKKH